MLKTYKYKILLVLGVLYSIALWHVSYKYHASGWEADKAKIAQQALQAEQDNNKANTVALQALEKKLSTIRSTQTTIQQKVIRETVKEPVYTECTTTPNIVRDIETLIDAGH